MEVRKGYKQTEVGIIPEDWEVKALGELGEFKNGINKGKEDFGFGHPFVNLMDVFGIPKISDSSNFGLINSTDVDRKMYELKKGDVLFVRSSVKPEGVGLTTLIAEDLPDTVFSGFLIRFRNKDDIAHEFKEHCFYDFRFRNRLIANSTVSANTNINQDALKALLFAFPKSKDEQQVIANVLSDMDALRNSLDALIAKKRLIKQGAMQELLTGKKRLPGFSGEWKTKSLSELFNISGGFTASRDQLSPNGYCYLHYGDIHMSNKTFIDVTTEFENIPKLNVPLKKVSEASILKDGDVVFVDASEDDEGTSRHVVVANPDGIPFISGLHTIVAKSKTDELANLYRRFCFQTRAVKNQFLFYAVGTKVSGISKSNIAKIKILVPSVPEQIAIAEILSDMDAEISALEQKREKTRLLKQGMMQELLTGRIRLI